MRYALINSCSSSSSGSVYSSTARNISGAFVPLTRHFITRLMSFNSKLLPPVVDLLISSDTRHGWFTLRAGLEWLISSQMRWSAWEQTNTTAMSQLTQLFSVVNKLLAFLRTTAGTAKRVLAIVILSVCLSVRPSWQIYFLPYLLIRKSRISLNHKNP